MADREQKLVLYANRIRSLAQNGLVYAVDEYNREWYEELLQLSHEILSTVSGHSVEKIASCFFVEEDYVTPKVDVRAVVFNERKELLLVRERADGCWSLPGGWADVGYSPGEIAVKEVREESGLEVKPVRLLAVYDKKCHPHPPALHYAYKLFIECELLGGTFHVPFDVLDCGFFSPDKLPPLSLERVLPEQIARLVELSDDPIAVVDFD